MVLVKPMWIAYCGEVHGSGRYEPKSVWHSSILRVKSRVEAYMSASGRLLTRLEEWVTREEGPQCAAMESEKAKRGAALKPLGTVDWESRPLVFSPTVPWETLMNLV